MRVVIGVVAALAGVVGGVLHAVNAAGGRTVDPSFWELSAFGAVAFGLTGAVLAARSSVRRIPTVLVAIGAGQGLSLLLLEYALLGPLPGDTVALWIGTWLWAPAFFTSATILPLLLPDGALPSRRWRPVLGLAIAAIAAHAIIWSLTPYHLLDVPLDVRGLRNPVGVDAFAHPVVTGFLIGITALAAAVSLASLVLRWRGAADERRQQLKWLALAGAATVLLFVAGVLVPQPLGALLVGLAALPVPVGSGIAALRHRLWEVDLAISTALRYAILSAVVVAVYAGTVTALGALTGAPAIATAVIALILLPLHSRLTRWVNRLVHGEADDPATALIRLGERLEATGDPSELADRLVPEMVVRITALLRDPRVAIQLADGDRVGAPDAGDTERIPLRYGGAEVGELILSRRQRSRGERRRLDRLAQQAAVAVHSALLAREARRARQLVVTAREEERRRLRWDLHDGVAPLIAGLALHAETARALVDRDPTAARGMLDALVPRLNAAVADVRALVHELRPPALDELGLPAAVRELASRIGGGMVTVDAGDLGSLPAAVDLATYRIVGEAVRNAVRHGAPDAVTVSLRRNGDALVVVVTDDGTGFAPDAADGVGLASMRQRAEELGGTFQVRTGGTSGTTVEARLPLDLEGDL